VLAFVVGFYRPVIMRNPQASSHRRIIGAEKYATSSGSTRKTKDTKIKMRRYPLSRRPPPCCDDLANEVAHAISIPQRIVGITMRVSTDEQDDQSQLRELRQYAKAMVFHYRREVAKANPGARRQ